MNNFVTDIIIRQIVVEMRVSSMIIERLHRKGYSEIFETSNGLLKCLSIDHYYQLRDFDIDELHNLEYVCGLRGLFLFALRHRTERRKGIYVGYLD